MEKNLVARGGRAPGAPPLDPPLIIIFFWCVCLASGQIFKANWIWLQLYLIPSCTDLGLRLQNTVRNSVMMAHQPRFRGYSNNLPVTLTRNNLQFWRKNSLPTIYNRSSKPHVDFCQCAIPFAFSPKNVKFHSRFALTWTSSTTDANSCTLFIRLQSGQYINVSLWRVYKVRVQPRCCTKIILNSSCTEANIITQQNEGGTVRGLNPL